MEKWKNLKRFLSMVLSISMVVGLMAVVEPREAEAAAGTNLVENSGFDTTDSWDGAGVQGKVQDVEIVETTVFEAGFEPSEGKNKVQPWSAGANATLDTSNTYGTDSKQSLKWDTTDSIVLEFVTFQVEAGKTYTISYDWIVENGSNVAYYSYLRSSRDNLQTQVSKSEEFWSAPTSWSHVDYEYTALEAETLYLYIEAYAGTVYIDNVNVYYETKEAKTELIKTTAFEAGFEVPEGMDKVQPWSAGANATLDTSNTYGTDSKQSLKWDTTDSIVLEFVTFQVEAGKTYTISYDWIVENGSNVAYYSYLRSSRDNLQTQVSKSEEFWSAPTSWSHVDYEYTALEAETLYLYIEAYAGTVYVDNVSVYYETEEPVMKLTDGIGNCDGAEEDSVLMMEELTEVSQDITVSAGNRYTYSFQLKNTATEADFSFGLYAGENAVNATIIGAASANGWREVNGYFDAPADATQISFKRAGTGTVYIDDVEFTEVQKVDMTLSEPAFDGETFSVTNNWTKEALDDIYGTREAAMIFNGSVWVNNTERKANYFLEKDGRFVLWNLGTNVGEGIIRAATQIEIREGTVITFEGHEDAPIVIQNTVTLEKSTSGVWYNPNVTEHTQLSGNPLPEGMTNLVEGGDCSELKNYNLLGDTTIADGMVHINVSKRDDYLQIHSIPVQAGHTYKISYYIWINGSNSLKYNMYAAGEAANENHEDWLMGLEESLTADTNAWQKVEFDWTATGSGTVAFGFKNYDENGTGQIYIDDIVVYDQTANLVETSVDATYSTMVEDDTVLQFVIPNDVIQTLTDTEDWPASTATVTINGRQSEVNIYISDYNSSVAERYFWIHGNAVTAAIATGKIVLVGPIVSTFDNEKITFNLAEGTTIEKLGSTWAGYTSIHMYPENNNVFYYNIDNGTNYVLTSSNNAIEVQKNDTVLDVKAGAELNEVGEYDIVRIENNEKFVQKVVLYKSGDAHTDTEYEITATDLVAVKWAALDENDNTLGEQFAADVNRSGTVDKFDAKVMRKALLSDSPNTYFAKVKGNTSLNGEMPIIGFDGPDTTFLNGRDADTIYSMINELGINTVMLNRDEVGTNYAWSSSQLSVAEKYGLKLYLNDGYINDETNEDGIGSNLGDSAKTKVSSITSQYDGYSSFGGYYIHDEPMYNEEYDGHLPINMFDVPLTTLKTYTNVHSYLNLRPYFSGELNEQYGGSNKVAMSYGNYKKYVDEASASGAESLSYDLYLRGNGVISELLWWQTTEYKIHTEDFWTNLDWMRTIATADNNNNPFYAYVQVGNDFISSKATKPNPSRTETDNLPTIQEMYFEANAALAMGAKGINYYSLIQPEEFVLSGDGTSDFTRSGLINYNGVPNDGNVAGDIRGVNYNYYDAAKKINAYIKAVDEVLMNATSEAVITKNSTVAGYLGSEVSSYGSIASINNIEVIVGCFDYYGQEAFMVVNITPDAGNSGSSQNVTLTFNGAQSGQYIGMNDTDWQTLNSSSTLTLDILAGEAVVIVLD